MKKKYIILLILLGVVGLIIYLAIAGFLYSYGSRKWDEGTRPVNLSFKLVKDASDVNNLIFNDEVLIQNSDISDAHVALDAFGERYIHIAMTRSGTMKFKNITEKNIGGRIAIILDGKTISAPIVQAPITDGQAQINLPKGTTSKEAWNIVAGILKYRDNSSREDALNSDAAAAEPE
jgi:preprotein translocase subunit SecD